MRARLLAPLLAALSVWVFPCPAQVVVTGNLSRVESLLESTSDSLGFLRVFLEEFLTYYEGEPTFLDAFELFKTSLDEFWADNDLNLYLSMTKMYQQEGYRYHHWWTNAKLQEVFERLEHYDEAFATAQFSLDDILFNVSPLSYESGANGNSILLVKDESLTAAIDEWINGDSTIDYRDVLNSIDGTLSESRGYLHALAHQDIHVGDTDGILEMEEGVSEIDTTYGVFTDTKVPEGEVMEDIDESSFMTETLQLSGDFNVRQEDFEPSTGETVITILSANNYNNIMSEAGVTSGPSSYSLEVSVLSNPTVGPWVQRLGGRMDQLWIWAGVIFRVGFAISIWRGVIRDMLMSGNRVG